MQLKWLNFQKVADASVLRKWPQMARIGRNYVDEAEVSIQSIISFFSYAQNLELQIPEPGNLDFLEESSLGEHCFIHLISSCICIGARFARKCENWVRIHVCATSVTQCITTNHCYFQLV